MKFLAYIYEDAVMMKANERLRKGFILKGKIKYKYSHRILNCILLQLRTFLEHL